MIIQTQNPLRLNHQHAITPFKLDNGWATNSTNLPGHVENIQFLNEFVSLRFNDGHHTPSEAKRRKQTPLGSLTFQKF